MIYIAYICGTMIMMFYNTWNFMFPDGFLPLEMGRWWHCYFMWVMDSKCIIVFMCLECWPISWYCVDYSLLSWLWYCWIRYTLMGLGLVHLHTKVLIERQGKFWCWFELLLCNVLVLYHNYCLPVPLFWWISDSYKMHIDYSPWWDLLC